MQTTFNQQIEAIRRARMLLSDKQYKTLHETLPDFDRALNDAASSVLALKLNEEGKEETRHE